MSLDLSDLSSSESEAGEVEETVPPNTYKLALEEVSYNRDVNAIHIPVQRQKKLVEVDTDRRRTKGKEKKTKNRRRKGGVPDEATPAVTDLNGQRSFHNPHGKSSNFKILSHKNRVDKRAYNNFYGSGATDAFVQSDVYIDPNFDSTNITETSSSVFKLNVNAQEFVPKFTSLTNK